MHTVKEFAITTVASIGVQVAKEKIMKLINEQLENTSRQKMQELANTPAFADALMRIYAFDRATGTLMLGDLQKGMSTWSQHDGGNMRRQFEGLLKGLHNRIPTSNIMHGMSALLFVPAIISLASNELQSYCYNTLDASILLSMGFNILQLRCDTCN